MIGEEPDVELRKLKGHGKLIVELMDNVKELEEDGGEAIILAGVVKVAPFEKIRVSITMLKIIKNNKKGVSLFCCFRPRLILHQSVTG